MARVGLPEGADRWVHLLQRVAGELHETLRGCLTSDGDGEQPKAEVAAEDRTDVPPGVSYVGELPVDELQPGLAPRGGPRRDDEVVPLDVAVDERLVFPARPEVI